MKISYSFGIIDLFHFGHLNALRKAYEGADLHIFGMVSDKAATAWLGSIVSNEEERKAVLESVSYVDEVMLQNTLDPTENLRILHRKYPSAEITLYHGNDWEVVPAEQFLKSIGGGVQIFDYYERLSPIKILQMLNSRANRPKQYKNLISTKANTLIALKDRLKLSIIEDISVYTIGQCKEDFDAVCSAIGEYYGTSKIVARSSSKNEDCFESSNAGHYESVLNIDAKDRRAVKKALTLVGESYSKDGKVDDDEQILVQSQTENVVYSGVVFTRDIQQNRPYYVINYDDDGGTDSVTSGVGGKVIWLAHDSDMEYIPTEWQGLISSVREIEELLKGMMLDIEFAINKKGETVIFQVRPLAANYKFKRDAEIDKLIDVKNKVVSEFKVYSLDEDKQILSDMAFWNPSEIIGDNSRNLDYSLYREIITRRAWSLGLAPMGYKLVDDDLMYKFGNKPYICVDYAFKSLIPNSIGEKLTNKLLDFYRDKLSKDFTAHDKIEFEIVLSCFDFETDDKLQELVSWGFTDNEADEIREALFELTIKGINLYNTVLQEDLVELDRLEKIRKEVVMHLKEDDSLDTYVKCFKLLIESLNLYGTPQFSRQARYAFIARVLCHSMISKGYITQIDYDLFMATIQTVATDFERDFKLFLSAKMSKEDFNEKYGHLRAGTYDIRTSRYDQMEFSVQEKGESLSEKLKGSPLPIDGVTKALKDYNLNISYEDFTDFIKNAFEQREDFKFIFTKSLSLAIEIVAHIGDKIGIERKELSYLEVPQILSADLYGNEKELNEFWNIIIAKRKEIHNMNSGLILPEVITSVIDFDFIKIGDARPNFITEKTVIGEVIQLEEDSNKDIEDKIVVIEKADPGFDWIFAKGIKALITKYGGVASHMAIRCAEFEIPAAIGCGERIYSFVKEISNLKLDCKNGKITEEM